MLIFAHIGKTGGSTVRSFFNPNLSIAEYHGHQSSIDVDSQLTCAELHIRHIGPLLRIQVRHGADW